MKFFNKAVQVASAAFHTGLKRKADRVKEVNEGEGEISSGNPEAEMSLIEHIIELRKHVFRAGIAVLAIFVILVGFMKYVVQALQIPYHQFRDIMARMDPPVEVELINIGAFDGVFTGFRMCFLVALVLSAPFIILEIWRFVSPALYNHEKRMARPLTFGSLILFYAGIGFGFFVITPTIFENVMKFTMDFGAAPTMGFKDYYSFLTLMTVIFGIIFEVPVIMTLLGIAGIIESELLIKNRKILVVITALLSAFLSPPDVLSMFAVGLPLYLMMEVSIISLKFLERKRRKEEEAAAAAELSNEAD